LGAGNGLSSRNNDGNDKVVSRFTIEKNLQQHPKILIEKYLALAQ
jgi:hypothetical protein